MCSSSGLFFLITRLLIQVHDCWFQNHHAEFEGLYPGNHGGLLLRQHRQDFPGQARAWQSVSYQYAGSGCQSLNSFRFLMIYVTDYYRKTIAQMFIVLQHKCEVFCSCPKHCVSKSFVNIRWHCLKCSQMVS